MTDTPPPRREFAIAVVLSVVVQGLVLLQLRDDPTFLTPIIDAATYHQQAIAYAAGIAPDGPFFQPPLYPLFLGVVYRLFGPNVLAAKLVQIVLGAIVAGLAAVLGGRLSGDRRVALLAGVLVALHGPLIFFQQQLLPAGLATFLGTLAILATWRARRLGSLAFGALAGILWGATSLTVANSLAVVAVLAALTLIHDVRARDGRATRTTIAVAVACAATIAPVTWHNFRTSSHFVPISTNAGINLWIGNNPEPARTLAIRPGAEWVELQREAALAGATDPVAMDAWFRGRVVDWARKEPGAFTGGLLRKAWQLLAAREIPRNLDLDTHASWSPILAALTFHAGGFAWPASLLLPLAGLGAVASARRDRGAAGLLAFALLYGATIVAFFPAARYRLPLAPIAAAFAAVGVRELFRRRSGIARAIVPVAVAAGIVAVSHPTHPATTRLDSASEVRRLVALELLARGDASAAEAQLDEALREAPESAENWNCLAAVRLREGRFEEALPAATRATSLDPGLPDAWLHRAMAAAELGDFPAAASAVERALAARPTFSAAELLRARIARARNEAAEARHAAERAVVLDPGSVEAGVLLAELLLESGDPEDARRAVETARRASDVERDASPLGHASPPTLRVLARALAETGDPERARRVLERAISFASSAGMRAALEEDLAELASRPAQEDGAAPKDGAAAIESRTAN